MMMMNVNQMLAFCFFIFLSLTFSVNDLTSFIDIVWKTVSVTVSEWGVCKLQVCK